MKRQLTFYFILSILTIITGSWGSTGHRKISTDASLSYNQQMQDFALWTSFLSDHASDADYRKQNDPDESPKHYIDIDSYYAFLINGRIPETLDSVVSMYGNSFVYNNGILPYATIATVESLQHYFQIRDMENAKVLAADLGHYVADGHMPLHITKNYDGDETGNSGIHSRYETGMINTFVDQIVYSGDSISVIPNITDYVFGYIYKNYTYIDSVLMADTYATNLAGNTNSYTYKQALWDNSKGFTTELFKQASHSLTELIYTAWVNAGSPSISASDIEDYEASHGNYLGMAYPNPFSHTVSFTYSLLISSQLDIQVRDIRGKVICNLLDEEKNPGKYELSWTPSDLAPGTYFLLMNDGKSLKSRKFVFLGE